VRFTLDDTRASEVCIAGTFNGWHPSATPMVAVGDGRWTKTLELEPGMHEYLFVIDGRWVADPGSAVTVPNPFGGINCCVNVR
jgi:1,4-alpha-glucan branching enzyme